MAADPVFRKYSCAKRSLRGKETGPSRRGIIKCIPRIPKILWMISIWIKVMRRLQSKAIREE